jgi:hypothetical protein
MLWRRKECHDPVDSRCGKLAPPDGKSRLARAARQASSFTGRWEDQEATYVVIDLEGAEYNVDLPEKIRGAVPSHGGAATAGDEP